VSHRRAVLLPKYCHLHRSGWNVFDFKADAKRTANKPKEKAKNKQNQRIRHRLPRTKSQQKGTNCREMALTGIHACLEEAWSLYREGHAGKAEYLFNHVIHSRRQTIGVSQHEMAMAYNDLAVLYHSQGRTDQAKPLYSKAINIMTQTLGEGHSATQIVRRNQDLLRKCECDSRSGSKPGQTYRT